MGKREILARVDADLDHGHTHPAVQRLNGLLSADPYDLDVRARLAAVHRRTGNPPEAGRWGYLTEHVTQAELDAFARAHKRSAACQLHALRLRGDHPRDLGPLAEARFAALTAEAAQEPQPWRRPVRSRPAPPPAAPCPAAPCPAAPPPAVPVPAVPAAPRGAAPESVPVPVAYQPPVPAAKPPLPDSPSPVGDIVVGVVILILMGALMGLGLVTVISWFL